MVFAGAGDQRTRELVEHRVVVLAQLVGVQVRSASSARGLSPWSAVGCGPPQRAHW